MAVYCSVDDCVKPIASKGMCHAHVRRLARAANTEICSEVGCTKFTASKGICAAHYQQKWRLEHPERYALQVKRDRENAKAWAAKKREQLLESKGNFTVRDTQLMAKFGLELAESDELKEAFWQFVKKELSL